MFLAKYSQDLAVTMYSRLNIVSVRVGPVTHRRFSGAFFRGDDRDEDEVQASSH